MSSREMYQYRMDMIRNYVFMKGKRERFSVRNKLVPIESINNANHNHVINDNVSKEILFNNRDYLSINFNKNAKSEA